MVKAILDKKFIQVQEDSDGEIFLEFPEDLLEQMNWSIGDTIVWTEMPNGMGYTVTKAKTLDG